MQLSRKENDMNTLIAIIILQNQIHSYIQWVLVIKDIFNNQNQMTSCSKQTYKTGLKL